MMKLVFIIFCLLGLESIAQEDNSNLVPAKIYDIYGGNTLVRLNARNLVAEEWNLRFVYPPGGCFYSDSIEKLCQVKNDSVFATISIKDDSEKRFFLEVDKMEIELMTISEKVYNQKFFKQKSKVENYETSIYLKYELSPNGYRIFGISSGEINQVRGKIEHFEVLYFPKLDRFEVLHSSPFLID